jgi:hypothetical protein
MSRKLPNNSRKVGPRPLTPPTQFRESNFDNDEVLQIHCALSPRHLTFEEKFVLTMMRAGADTPMRICMLMGNHWRDVEDIIAGLELIGLVHLSHRGVAKSPPYRVYDLGRAMK